MEFLHRVLRGFEFVAGLIDDCLEGDLIFVKFSVDGLQELALLRVHGPRDVKDTGRDVGDAALHVVDALRESLE